jgi:hypothetical protein
MYADTQSTVTFTACNDPKSHNDSGNAGLFTPLGKSMDLSISGEASCSFSNTDEQHRLTFTLE